MDVYIHIFLISAQAGGEWSVSRSGRFNPGERAPGTHWIGSWVDPRAGLNKVEKKTFLTLEGPELRPLGRPTRTLSKKYTVNIKLSMFVRPKYHCCLYQMTLKPCPIKL
jgi:hypothetical protein